jgi:hypothetical protein
MGPRRWHFVQGATGLQSFATIPENKNDKENLYLDAMELETGGNPGNFETRGTHPPEL